MTERLRPTRAQRRAHRAAIARRLGLRRSEVRVSASAVRAGGVVLWGDPRPAGVAHAVAALCGLRALSWPSGVERHRRARAHRMEWARGEPDGRRRGGGRRA